MPKFMTYQRPAPVTKQNWNHAPARKAELPRKAPEQQQKLPATMATPPLDQLLRKQ
jgi:hypothetical protein